ncbi:hypothetical protein [Haloferax volcanii]|uniref:hypothetical protein n=3 Tax=Haloferax volcanii TaxID=2246 RepID=UPI001F461432|nr:hypothetical protein [Haloferax volcanii]
MTSDDDDGDGGDRDRELRRRRFTKRTSGRHPTTVTTSRANVAPQNECGLWFRRRNPKRNESETAVQMLEAMTVGTPACKCEDEYPVVVSEQRRELASQRRQSSSET